MAYIPILGNTYPVKDAIKSLGGKWDPAQKVWMVPSENAEKARQLVIAAPRIARPQAGTYRRFTSGKCRVSGCGSIAVQAGYCKQCAFDEFDN